MLKRVVAQIFEIEAYDDREFQGKPPLYTCFRAA